MALVYFIAIGIMIVLFFWTKDSIKTIENTNLVIKMVSIVIIGVIIATLIIFAISKIGINYQSKQIYKEVKKVALMLFIPINALISLPQIAKIVEDIEAKQNENEKIKKRIIIIAVLIIIAIIFEIGYLKDFQNGIIELLNK